MTLSIIDPEGMLSDRQRQLAERRFLFTLSRYASRVYEAEVSLARTADSGVGLVCKCQVVISVRNASDVLLSEYDADVNKCIARAAERASRAVARSVNKALYLHRSRSVAMNAGAFR